MTAAPTPPRLLRAAFVRRPHGIRGELRVEPLGGDAARFARGMRLLAEAGGSYTVEAATAIAGGDLILALEEVRDRTAAERLRGAYLCVPGSERRTLRDGEWFVHELVGLRALTVEGADLGRVVDVEDYGEQQVLVIAGRKNEGPVRLPMVREFVACVDVDGGIVEVTPWPEEEA